MDILRFPHCKTSITTTPVNGQAYFFTTLDSLDEVVSKSFTS